MNSLKKYALIILLTSFFMFSCKKPTSTTNKFVHNAEIYKTPSDLKIMDPRKVNKKTPLAYIDTTHTSLERIIKWNFVDTSWIVNEMKVFKNKDEYKVNSSTSLKWVRIREYENTFYLYEPSDGHDMCFELFNNYLLIYGMETTAIKLKGLRKIPPNTIELVPVNSKRFYDKIPTIKKVNELGIHQFKFPDRKGEYSYYMIPINLIRTFPVVVNHTPNNKQFELFNWH